MNRLVGLTLMLLATFLGGCAAPLAPTRFVILSDPGIEGKWRFDPSPGGDSGPMIAPVTTMNPSESASAGSDALLRQLTVNPGPGVRYFVTLEFPDAKPDTKTPPVVLDGQLIETKSHRLFTFQGSWAAWMAAPMFVPMQRTMRIDRDGDNLRLYSSRVDLVWVPLPLAGELAFTPPSPRGDEPSTIAIAQTADQVFEFLESAPESNWTFAITGARVP